MAILAAHPAASLDALQEQAIGGSAAGDNARTKWGEAESLDRTAGR